MIRIRSVILCISLWSVAFGGVPAPARFYDDQLIDHLDCDIHKDLRWSQRYYLSTDHFRGPGSPIFVIMGGEGAIEPTTGFMYPFVMRLAQNFGAMVLEPEHRFYGASQPASPEEIRKEREAGRPDPRIKLLTSEQALNDAVRLIQLVREGGQCSMNKTSSHYCPVITVGGSYPGFLSAMARFHFPDVVDMAYAASAPMKFYAQTVNQDAYYNHITAVTEDAFPGCPDQVRKALELLLSDGDNITSKAEKLGVCEGTVPSYVTTVSDFVEEVVMMVGYTFANLNMAFYPPRESAGLIRACETFSRPDFSPIDRLRYFLVENLGENRKDCFAMTSQLPSGPNATISSGDWSGVGTGRSGENWDFQTCSLLVETIGFGNSSMFIPRKWTVDWLKDHCLSRFGVEPTPTALVDSWHFDQLVKQNASHIIFTNGLLDGWSVSGIQDDLSDTIVSLNFPNGAHHSDLSGHFPSQRTDTADILAGQAQVQFTLAVWLEELGWNGDSVDTE